LVWGQNSGTAFFGAAWLELGFYCEPNNIFMNCLSNFVLNLDGLSQLYVLPNPLGANPAVLYKSPG